MDPTSPFINASSINNTVLLRPSFISNTNHTYLNVPHVRYSNRINYSYTYSDTLLPTNLNFVFILSGLIASEIIDFFVQALTHTSSNMLQLFVFDNMLNKHFKQPLIFHIDLLLLAFSNRNDKTFKSIIRSCIITFGFR